MNVWMAVAKWAGAWILCGSVVMSSLQIKAMLNKKPWAKPSWYEIVFEIVLWPAVLTMIILLAVGAIKKPDDERRRRGEDEMEWDRD